MSIVRKALNIYKDEGAEALDQFLLALNKIEKRQLLKKRAMSSVVLKMVLNVVAEIKSSTAS